MTTTKSPGPGLYYFPTFDPAQGKDDLKNHLWKRAARQRYHFAGGGGSASLRWAMLKPPMLELARSFENHESDYLHLINKSMAPSTEDGAHAVHRLATVLAESLDQTTAGKERWDAAKRAIETLRAFIESDDQGSPTVIGNIAHVDQSFPNVVISDPNVVLNESPWGEGKAATYIVASGDFLSHPGDDSRRELAIDANRNQVAWEAPDAQNAVSIRVSMPGNVSPLDLSMASMLVAQWMQILGLKQPRLEASFAGSAHQKYVGEIPEGESRNSVIQKAKEVGGDILDAARKRSNESRAAAAKAEESSARAQLLTTEQAIKDAQSEVDKDPGVIAARKRKEIAEADQAEASARREQIAALRELGELSKEFPELAANFLKAGNSVSIGNNEVVLGPTSNDDETIQMQHGDESDQSAGADADREPK